MFQLRRDRSHVAVPVRYKVTATITSGHAPDLLLAGLVWGAVAVKRLERELKWEKSEIKRMKDESGDDSARFNRSLRDSGIRFSTWNDGLYDHQDTQLAALEHIKPSFSGPYALTVLGALLYGWPAASLDPGSGRRGWAAVEGMES